MPAARPQGSVTYNNSGRIAFVTGGASGIGKAICEAFVRSSASVVCFDINAELRKDLPTSVEFISGDVSQETDCQRAVETTVSKFNALDILVNNAAIQSPESYVPLHELPTAEWNRMLGVNLSGYSLMAKHALRPMLRQRRGVIINIASGQAHRATRGVPAYGPIKAANLMQTRQWGVEYARYGIRVVSVSPGAIDTPLVRSTLEAQGGEAELANRHPLGRIGEPEEIAHAVLWLSSGHASFVTGTDLEVDGGLGAFGAFADPYSITDHDESQNR